MGETTDLDATETGSEFAQEPEVEITDLDKTEETLPEVVDEVPQSPESVPEVVADVAQSPETVPEVIVDVAESSESVPEVIASDIPEVTVDEQESVPEVVEESVEEVTEVVAHPEVADKTETQPEDAPEEGNLEKSVKVRTQIRKKEPNS